MDTTGTRKIKPQTPSPITRSDVLEPPSIDISTRTGSRLLGIKKTYFKKVVRETLGESITESVPFEHVIDAYFALRPSLCLLSQHHLTTSSGMNGLKRLAKYMDGEWERADEITSPKIVNESAISHVQNMPTDSVQTVVTSPPYWGTRVYPDSFHVTWSTGNSVALGGEATPEQYIRNTLEFFAYLEPVLKDTATVWWNVGDVYNSRVKIRSSSTEKKDSIQDGDDSSWSSAEALRYSAGHEYLKDKDLTLIPHRLAEGLQRLGYWVRSVIIWKKSNVVPGAVTDRPETNYETILLISKSSTYKFSESEWVTEELPGSKQQSERANIGEVWEFSTAQRGDSHVAQFPIELPSRCILLSTDEGDRVYDPFIGSGTTAGASKQLRREWCGAEIVPDYIELARERVSNSEVL